MKATLHIDKITLSVNGREMTFSEEELIAILEEHFSGETDNEVVEEIVNNEISYEIATTPTEAKMFRVDPESINRKLFEEQREDANQEETRKLILEAFAEMDNNPEKYAKTFFIMIPEKTWEYKNVSELKDEANKLGDHNANWVEQALEWAQRIANGESWSRICNDTDPANWYRLVIWKNGYPRFVGSACKEDCYYSETDVTDYDYCINTRISSVVPLVVLYK